MQPVKQSLYRRGHPGFHTITVRYKYFKNTAFWRIQPHNAHIKFCENQSFGSETNIGKVPDGEIISQFFFSF
jgi:hypothetical protein